MIDGNVEAQHSSISDGARGRVASYGDIVELDGGVIIADADPWLDTAFV